MIHSLLEVYTLEFYFLLTMDPDKDNSMHRIKVYTWVPDRVNHADVVARTDLDIGMNE
jgi:hypothetical protein